MLSSFLEIDWIPMVIISGESGDKKHREYKNWVKILRSDSYRRAILARKNGENGKI